LLSDETVAGAIKSVSVRYSISTQFSLFASRISSSLASAETKGAACDPRALMMLLSKASARGTMSE
jgi:hypothetical protein